MSSFFPVTKRRANFCRREPRSREDRDLEEALPTAIGAEKGQFVNLSPGQVHLYRRMFGCTHRASRRKRDLSPEGFHGGSSYSLRPLLTLASLEAFCVRRGSTCEMIKTILCTPSCLRRPPSVCRGSKRRERIVRQA